MDEKSNERHPPRVAFINPLSCVYKMFRNGKYLVLANHFETAKQLTYRKIYFSTNNTASTYIKGFTFLALPVQTCKRT